MFRGDPRGKAKARRISTWLSDHRYFKSHGRHIPRAELESKKLKILPLERDPVLQDLVLSVFHATTHTFNAAAVKIVENHLGKAFIKNSQSMLIPAPGPPLQQLPQPSPAP